MTGRSQLFQHWQSVAQLNNAANRLIRLGSDNGARIIAVTLFMPYLTFSLYADRALTLDIETATDNVNWRIAHTLVTLANTYMTPYDLPDPKNKTGWLVIGAPQMRIRLTNNSGVNTAVLEFFASLTNQGG
jgi:hypothetical protein